MALSVMDDDFLFDRVNDAWGCCELLALYEGFGEAGLVHSVMGSAIGLPGSALMLRPAIELTALMDQHYSTRRCPTLNRWRNGGVSIADCIGAVWTWCMRGLYACFHSYYSLTLHALKDGIGLLHQIHLQSNEIVNVFGRLPGNGYHGQQIDKGLSCLSVVDDAGLRLFALHHVCFDMVHGGVVSVLSSGSNSDSAIGCLQKPAVSSHHFAGRIASQSFKHRRGVHEWKIVLFGINNNKGAG